MYYIISYFYYFQVQKAFNSFKVFQSMTAQIKYKHEELLVQNGANQGTF